MIKLEKLFDYMEELGITIIVDRWGAYMVADNEWPGKDLYFKDADNGENITCIPSFTEYKVIYED